ncbi:EH domain-containing protein 1-like isoform X2 [Acanthaster planci]|uniref:EH domain-containing protein 1-like isoform X2 n=1 Tax=Acanthaster planci TaxID=133434 RepID=A0A8B7ZQM3_ACAPL|nr:EH domain-containing protein 1-like isoform X2 [Acanthaster planci]
MSLGLIKIADKLGLRLLAPRKKINILLIGNHSAGKSSFINWYIEEHVQKTGVAIETQGFTFVTSGRKRESLTGNATLHLYPHFKELAKLEGVVEYLTTEISTSKQKRFSLVTFVDTPGLVDGDMKYPFDVDKAIIWLGNLADLIFVFFDPIGQALCKRTLNLVEKLNETHADRMKFYLSKADEAGHESDRQRVLMQIVQELCKRPGLNRTGFDMPTIYVPTQSSNKSRCVNQIETVCVHIEKAINQTIQNTLNSLEKDCENIASLIDKRLDSDRAANSYNLRARGKGFIFFLLGLLLPAVLLVNFLASNVSNDVLVSTLGKNGAETLKLYLRPIGSMWESIPRDYHLYALIGLVVSSLLLLVLAKMSTRLKSTLSRKQKRVLSEQKDFVQNHVRVTKEKLYSEYLQQSVAAHDLN